MEKTHHKKLFLISCLAIAGSGILGLILPMVTDEAYYVDWATRSSWPSLGFFDHPPAVSWIASGVRIWHHIVAARAMVWIFYLISLYYNWKSARIFTPNRAMQAVVLISTSIGGIASGILLTPDTGLIVMWSIATHESILAIRGHKKRWLTAGLATGLGIFSKYTMVLIGPVFLWALFKDSKKQLKTPWPYLGGFVCLLVVIPHFWWQSNNEWITVKFQFAHGLSVKPSLNFSTTLPYAKDPEIGSPTLALRSRLLASLSGQPGFSEMVYKPKPDKNKWELAIQYVGDYLGGVLGLWGLYSITAIVYWLRTVRRSRKVEFERRPGFAVIEAGAMFPLLLFGLLSPFSKIEANWAAMHMAPMAVLLTTRMRIKPKVLTFVFAGHAVVMAIIGIILLYPQEFPFARKNRLLLEAKGYAALGDWIRRTSTSKVIAVDSYQLKSAVRYYAPMTDVVQWPGFTRGSEYTRGFLDDKILESKILLQPDFMVISMNSMPKIIPGFEAYSYAGIRVCPNGDIGIFSESEPRLPCENGLREWWVTSYKAEVR